MREAIERRSREAKRHQGQVISAMVQQRIQTLQSLLQDQIELLPAGCSDWADTADQIEALNQSLETIRGAFGC